MVAQLFTTLSIRYGSRWTRELPGDARMLEIYRNEWRNRLKGCTWKSVMRALDEYAQTEWSRKGFPPSLEEVRARGLVKPEDVGLPEREAAFQDLYWMRWQRHPVIWSIGRAIREHHPQVFKFSDAQLRPLFDEQYDRHFEQARRGETFHWPDQNARQLAHDRPKKVTGHATARAHLDALRQQMGMGR